MKSKASTSMLRTFLPFIRKQQTLLAGAFFMLLASSGLRLLEPWPLAFAIDIVMGDAQDNPLLNGFNINQLSMKIYCSCVRAGLWRSPRCAPLQGMPAPSVWRWPGAG